MVKKHGQAEMKCFRLSVATAFAASFGLAPEMCSFLKDGFG